MRPDREWLARLFDEYYEALCAFVYSFVFSDDAAEDLVQDLFVSIWQDPERWTEAGDALRPLLYVAARNRALNQLRHHRVRESYAERILARDTMPTAPPADAALMHELIQRELEVAIEALPDRAREIFRMSRDEGLTYREIAARLGLAVKTVENHMNLALKRLRTHMAEYLALIVAFLLS